MNARQKVKNLKKKINTINADNDFMRRIIANSPTMEELYDAYNKPLNIKHTTIQFQEYRAKRIIPDTKELIEYTKQALARDLFEVIKENITYEIDGECMTPIITASIFVGRK